MSASKHTPGPWRLEADPAHFDSLTTVTGGQRMNANQHAWPAHPLTVQVGGMAALHEMQANARLIAAAPELLEALKLWLDIHDKPAGFIGKFGKSLTEAIAAQEVKVNAAAAAARAAIAKAGGTA